MTPTKIALVLTLASGSFWLGRASLTQEAQARTASLTAPGPGTHHQALNDLAGDFDAHLSMWVTPGTPPLEFEGTCTNRWILDGRFLEQEFQANLMGTPFRGHGLIGYSDLEGSYQTLWVDNTSNELLFSAGGRTTEDGRSLIVEGQEPDALLGRKVPFRDVTTLESRDRYLSTKYRYDEDGAEVRLLQIAYTRRPTETEAR